MSSPHRWLTRAVVGGAAGALAVTLAPGTAYADHDDLPPGRRLLDYTVRPGDTATELAVRFHAWTAELIDHNHLGPAATLRVGQRITIPVVRSAVQEAEQADDATKDRGDRKRRKAAATKGTTDTTSTKGTRPRPSKAERERRAVARTIRRTAKKHGVDPQLAQAISWQEAGWRMHHVSSAGAVGAMQVIPTTGTWMSWYADRPLDLHRRRDNVLAGVLLLDVLEEHTDSQRRMIGAYYQGLGAVHRYGLYDETHRYVDNVQAIRARLERGLPPA